MSKPLLKDVEAGLVAEQDYLESVADEAGIVVMSQAILQAVAAGDEELTCIPEVRWEMLAMSLDSRLTEILESRGDILTPRRRAAVVKAAGKKSYRMIAKTFGS